MATKKKFITKAHVVIERISVTTTPPHLQLFSPPLFIPLDGNQNLFSLHVVQSPSPFPLFFFLFHFPPLMMTKTLLVTMLHDSFI
jgi:hypothetical protein